MKNLEYKFLLKFPKIGITRVINMNIILNILDTQL